jgi:hypothetical protein
MKKLIGSILFALMLMASLANNFFLRESSTMLAVATRTPTRTPTKKPTTKFNVSSSNRVAPNDILKEISFFSIGGGGGYCPKESYPIPAISYKPKNEELVTTSVLVTCGWQKGERLKGIIRYPNGKTITRYIYPRLYYGDYFATLSIKPTLTDPTGRYDFTLKGKNTTLTATAYFRKPAGPRLFQADNTHLLLYGFVPRESIRLYYYDIKGKFSGWQSYKVDSRGQLTIEIPTTMNGYFFALGERTGEVRLRREDSTGGFVFDAIAYKSIKLAQYCPGPPSRMTAGISGRVAYTDGSNMRIRQQPGFSASILNTVPEGTQFMVLAGPRCADQVTWWKIQTTNDYEGWMAESQNGVYLIEQYP